MNSFVPNRQPAGKAVGGQFAHKVHGEQEIDLPMDEPAERPRPKLTSFGLTMLKVEADSYRAAGIEVPERLATIIEQGEHDREAKAADEQARREASRPQPEATPEAEPEVIHDLTTDEGRAAAVRAAEIKKDGLLRINSEADAAVKRAESNIRALRNDSYKGISFDVARLEEKAEPLRAAAKKAHGEYLAQVSVWNDARDYAEQNRSTEGRELIERHRAARRAVVDAKSRLSILIHNGAPEDEKEVARSEWRAAIAAEQSIKGVPRV